MSATESKLDKITAREEKLFDNLETVISIEGILEEDIPLFLLREYAAEVRAEERARWEAIKLGLNRIANGDCPPNSKCSDTSSDCHICERKWIRNALAALLKDGE